MVEFFNYLNNIHPLSADATTALLKVVKPRELRRGQVLLQEGVVCDKIYFVVKGLLKLHFETGTKELIMQFARENDIMLSVWSYFEGKPSRYAIRAIEPSVILTIAKAELEHLLERFPELNLHLFIIGRDQIGSLEDHLGLMMLPAFERFERVIQSGSWIGEGRRIPDKLLAAYLGVWTSTVCEWRKGYGKKQG